LGGGGGGVGAHHSKWVEVREARTTRPLLSDALRICSRRAEFGWVKNKLQALRKFSGGREGVRHKHDCIGLNPPLLGASELMAAYKSGWIWKRGIGPV